MRRSLWRYAVIQLLTYLIISRANGRSERKGRANVGKGGYGNEGSWQHCKVDRLDVGPVSMRDLTLFGTSSLAPVLRSDCTK